MLDYTGTVSYWDKVFNQDVKDVNINTPIRFPDMEAGLQWLCRNTSTVLDFGCGRGTVLFRCLGLGVSRVTGVDISPNAVSLATRTAERYELDDQSEFITGGIDVLKDMTNDAFDAAILFNIVDNLIPDDARSLLAEIHRIVKSGGRILMKLNDQYPDEDLRESDEFNEITPGFYHETSGLFLWSLSEADIEDLVAPWFEIEHSGRVELEKNEFYNRIYYLRNRE